MEPVAMKTDCGTVMCIAGHTLELAGYKMRVRGVPVVMRAHSIIGRRDFDFIAPNGSVVDEPLEIAARELGLEFTGMGMFGAEGDRLFHDFSLKTPKQAAARIEALISDNVPTRA